MYRRSADHLVLGSSSSRGRLVTADAFARLRLVNPVTGEQQAPPAIETTPCVFAFEEKPFIRGPRRTPADLQ